MKISLTKPVLSSLDTFLKLIDELFAYEALPQKVEQTATAVKQLLATSELGQAWFIEVEENGETCVAGHLVVSYAFSLEHGGKVGFIDQFYLKPEWRQKGIGASLIPQVEDRVMNDGVKALSLEVNIGNAGARTFYERHGFVPRRQFCVMTKNLAEKTVPLHVAS